MLIMDKSLPQQSVLGDPRDYDYTQHIISRRRFLTWCGMAAALCIAPEPLMAAASRLKDKARRLCFYHTHTGERLQIVYWDNQGYVKEALGEIDHLLRDHHTNAVHRIDPGLLDLLHGISVSLGRATPLHVLSAYRSPATNAKLRTRGNAAAGHSLHMKGRAVDIYVPGGSLAALRRTALALKGGGVGYYPRNGFVHLDVGPIRYWERAGSKRFRRRAA